MNSDSINREDPSLQSASKDELIDLLEREQKRFSAIFDASPVGLLLLDIDSTVMGISHSLTEMIISNPADVIGKRMGAVLGCPNCSNDDRQCGYGKGCDHCSLKTAIDSAISTQMSTHNLDIEVDLFIDNAFEKRWVCIDAEPIDFENESKVIVAIQDVTDRHIVESNLRDSQRLLEETQRVAQIGTFTLYFSTREWTPSDQLRSILGISPSFQGSFEKWIELIHPDDRENMGEYYQEVVLEKGASLNKEYRIIRPSDGEVRWVYSRGEVTKDDSGNLVKMVGTILDVTDLKKSQKEATNRELFLNSVIDTSVDAIWEMDKDGTVIDVNKRVEDLYEFSSDEVIGKNIRDLDIVHGDSNSFYTHLSEESIWQFESKHRKKSGEFFDVETSVVFIDQGEGLYISFCRDISERKRIEQEMLAQKKRLAESQQMAHLGNWELDLKSNTLQWSAEIYHIFELDSKKVNASYDAFLAAMHPDDRDKAEAVYKSSLETQIPYDYTHRLQMKDGRIKYVHEHSYTEFDADGTPLVSRGTIQDITASYLIERGREDLQKQLHQSQKMEAVGLLAGGVAHDFNNMLGVILGHTEELLAGISIDNPLFESIYEIEKAATRSATLTRQLLAFSRQEVIVPKRLNLNETVEGTLAMLRRLIGENVKMEWCPTDSVMPVFVDPGQIDQILANLTVNARDAIEDSGTITITTEYTQVDIHFCKDHPGTLPGDYIRLSVRDSGSGIDKETQRKIFEPFFTTKGEGKGTGLGLSTVYGIVQQNGGAITVDSNVGEGTTFSIYFPCDNGEIVQTVEHIISKEQLKGDETILLVEDEEMLLHTLERVLKRHGYTVIAVSEPEEALAVIEKRKDIRILVTDVIMPVINGRELADEIKRYLPNIRSLFMSGYTANHITDYGSSDEEINFIQKPFQFNDFLRKIREALL